LQINFALKLTQAGFVTNVEFLGISMALGTVSQQGDLPGSMKCERINGQ
jgi:hypothetical protein